MKNNSSCHLAEGFTLPEKIFAQITFNGFWITALVAIWQQSVPGTLVYFALVAYGIVGLVQRRLACPRCPHLYQYGDCLQVPPQLTKLIVKTPTTGPMNQLQRFAFVMVFVVVTLFPQYWLVSKPAYFVVFWVFCGAWYAGQLLYFCKHLQALPHSQLPVLPGADNPISSGSNAINN